MATEVLNPSDTVQFYEPAANAHEVTIPLDEEALEFAHEELPRKKVTINEVPEVISLPFLAQKGDRAQYQRTAPSETASLIRPAWVPDLREDKRWFDTILRAVPAITLVGILAATTVSIFYDLRIFFGFATLFVGFNLWVQSHVGIYLIKFFMDWVSAEGRNFHTEYQDRRSTLMRSGVPEEDLVSWERVVHYVAIANYNEHLEQLADTMNTLSAASMSRTNIVVVLAMEAREVDAPNKAAQLKEQFADKFLDVIASYHPPGLPGELSGKESNVKWAVQAIAEDAKTRGFNERQVCITIADADTYFDQRYFDCLTASYCNDVHRHEKIWQGPMVCYKNYMSVPAPTRLLAMMVSVYEMASLSNSRTFRLPFSSYSASLSLHLLAPYDGCAVAEDWHKLIKSFFMTSGRVTVEPMPFPNMCWAVESDGWFSSVRDRFVQAIRHAWGITEVIYFLKMWVRWSFVNKDRRLRPNVWRALDLLGKMTSIHLLSGVGFFFMTVPLLIMSLYQYIPSLAASHAAPFVGGSWSLLFRILFYAAFLPMALTFLMNIIIIKRLLKGQHEIRWYHIGKWILELLVVLTPVNFIFGQLPTLYSSVRAMFTDDFVYITAAKPAVHDV